MKPSPPASLPARLDWRSVLGVWTAVGALLILQTYVLTENPPRTVRGHAYLCLGQLYRAWLWAALTPCVFALRRELRARHRSRWVIGALHVLAAVALCVWANIIRIGTLNVSFGYWLLEEYSIHTVLQFVGWRSSIDFFFYWALLVAAYVVELNAERREATVRAEQLRTQLAQAELAALKQQVQPHFLFNALNAIASLMREGEAAKAIEALARLSTLLRQLMQHAGKPEVELWRELDYAQCYLSIEKVRFEERLSCHFDADEAALAAWVPTLILQPLVENAVKHGISRRRTPGRVSVTARILGDRLRLQVTNDPAEGPAADDERNNHGLGLRATRERLERAFGPAQRLHCHFTETGESVVTVELPLRLNATAEIADPLAPASSPARPAPAVAVSPSLPS